ncbi:MAG: alpha/beta fold hydrolase [Bryobacterales bacterium]|nr:alpha/beta fold hydrolase [Bryobacterales bacterium]
MSLSSEARITAVNAAVEQLTRIWESILGIDSIQPDQDYFDLGGDSSLAVQMFAQIEKLFRVKLPLATLYEAPTISGLARILSGETASSGWSPLVPIQPEGSRPPFFCFHGAGGNVLNYQKLSEHLGPDQPFYGLQSPGLDGASQPLTSIEEMAALYIKEIRAVQPYGPYFLGGYCMGGTVAYEAAQQLTSTGETVAMLALLDTMNWHKIPLTFWSKSSHASQQVLFHAASLLDLNFADKVEFFKEKLESLRNRIPVWRGMLASMFAKPGSNEPSSPSVILGRIWRTNDQASWNYIPRPYPGTVTDIRPARQYRVFSKPDLKWDQLARGGQHVIVLPVYPASMLVEPFVAQLARSLRICMDEAISAGQQQEAPA